jgi:hypothetical protein
MTSLAELDAMDDQGFRMHVRGWRPAGRASMAGWGCRRRVLMAGPQ